jgi:hypothetical protein
VCLQWDADSLIGANDLGLPPMRHCGVRTADWPAVPGSARCCRGAVISNTEREFPSGKVYPRNDRGIVGVESPACRAWRSSSSTPVLDVRPVVTVPRWCMAALVTEVLTALPSVWSSQRSPVSAT